MSLIRGSRGLGLALGYGLLASGCVTDGLDDAAGGNTSEASQDVSWLQTWSWGTPGSAGPDLDLGLDTQKTCMLTGIHGSLKAYPGANGTPYTTARAGVYRSGGHWWVQTRAGNGPGVSAQGICIPYTGNRVELTVYEANQSSGFNPSVPATPGRQCFLTSVSATGWGWAAYLSDWPFGPPGVSIAQEGSNWVFRSWLNGNSTGQNAGSANAVCVDVTPNWGLGYDSEAGTATLTSKLFDNGAGVACALTGLFGVFTNDWNHPGAEVFPDSQAAWWVTLAPRNEILTHCSI
jgi:hypothetical protein